MKRLLSLLCLLLPAAVLSAASYRYVVLPVEFSDVSFTDTNKYIKEKVQTAQDYLNSQFSPSSSFVFHVFPSEKLPYPLFHYGANTSSAKDVGIAEAIRGACMQSKEDFSHYDCNNDGYIDNICIIFAGHSESDGSGSQYIWPQHLYMHDLGGGFALSGKVADSFTVCSEFSSAGVFCHEFLHSFGLMDLYDTDGKLSGGTSKGLWGKLSIMDNPDSMSNLSAIELEHLNLGSCMEVKEGEYSLRPLSRAKEYLRIDTDNQDEYFLLECRDNEGWDASLGGHGLVVYHIDRSLNDSWYSDMYRRNLSAAERWSLNQVNCRPEHACARVVEAVPGSDDFRNVFFPQDGHGSFGSETNPPFRFWSGNTSSLALTNITLQQDGSVNFKLITPLNILSADVFQDAAIISWSIDESLAVKECTVTWRTQDSSASSKYSTSTVIPGPSGICSATLESLAPQTDYQANVKLICYDGAVYSRTIEFRTKMVVSGARPYIWVKSLEQADDGSFIAGGKLPLRIFNGEGVETVRWYFNGLRIFPEEDGHWTLKSSGLLKAEVWYSDGSKEIIIKRLRVQ
ncbi:MAG: immune inhibitor A [Bacteroidales bacterium]|nr:immune inhibitor A [Bacteroidales bacterium]